MQTLRFCFGAVVAVIVGASLGAKGLRKDTVDKDKAFSQLFLWHLGVVLVFVLASGLTSAPPSTESARRLSNGLVVAPVTVDSGRLSLPFALMRGIRYVRPLPCCASSGQVRTALTQSLRSDL